MDGGILPWRLQKLNILKFLTAESYGKPLPPPPIGFIWEKKADRSWELRNVSSNIGCGKGKNEILSVEKSHHTIKDDGDQQYPCNEIEHTVMPEDTLQGICLHYRVSAIHVRRLNMFSGNNIQFKKVLRIPLDSSIAPVGAEVMKQKDTPEVLIQKFKNATNEMALEARSYLEDSNWDFQVALSRCEEDSRWELSKVNSSTTIQQQLQQPDMFVKTLQIVDEDEGDTEDLRLVPPVEVVTVEGRKSGVGGFLRTASLAAAAAATGRETPRRANNLHSSIPSSTLHHAIPIPPAAVQYDPPVLVDMRCGRDEEQDEAEIILARPYESTCTVPLLG